MVMLVAVVVALALYIGRAWTEPMLDGADLESWKHASASSKQRIADKVISSNLLANKQRQEVYEILGVPSYTNNNKTRCGWFITNIKTKTFDPLGLYDDRQFLELVFSDDRVVDACIHIDRH
jgi:hypothetical protein